MNLPMLNLLADSGGSFWMPRRASTYAPDVDWLFYFIYAIALFFVLLIFVLLILFVAKYRKRGDCKPEPAPAHHTGLELVWTFIPTVIVVVIFYFGFKSFLNMSVAPPNSYEIVVTAFKWGYNFTYPNGVVDNELHVPLDRPVQLVLTSEDVIHGVYIPAFRIKKDAVPGRYNKLWFQATQEGEFDLFCTQYCGMKHSQMRSKVIVQDASQFNRWLDEAANFASRMPPAEAGKLLYQRRGCTQCHTIDGNNSTGPTLKNVYGHMVTLNDGRSVLADEDYIRESIFDPNAKIVAGFASVPMPTFKGRLKDNEMLAIIAFLKTISDKGPPPTPPSTRPTTAPSPQSVLPTPEYSTLLSSTLNVSSPCPPWSPCLRVDPPPNPQSAIRNPQSPQSQIANRKSQI